MEDLHQKIDIGKYYLYYSRVIGAGAYGKVHLGISKKTAQMVAIKILNVNLIGEDKNDIQSFKEEATNHKKLDHPNIVKCYDWVMSPNQKTMYIILEYCTEGTLKQEIAQTELQEPQQALDILKQICQAYQYMLKSFKEVFVHRDIKSDNIIIHRDSKGYKIYKLADFGFSKQLNDDRQIMKTQLGTPLYMSPQIHNKQQYSSKSDIFSIGILFCQVVYGIVPWDYNTTQVEKMNRVTAIEKLKQNINRIPIDQILTNDPKIKAIYKSILDKFPDQQSCLDTCNDILAMCLQYYEEDRCEWSELFAKLDSIEINQSQQKMSFIFLKQFKPYVESLYELQHYIAFVSLQIVEFVSDSINNINQQVENQLKTDIIQLVVYLLKISRYLNQFIKIQYLLVQSDKMLSQVKLHQLIPEHELDKDTRIIDFIEADLIFILKNSNDIKLKGLIYFIQEKNWNINECNFKSIQIFLRQQSEIDPESPVKLIQFIKFIKMDWLLNVIQSKIKKLVKTSYTNISQNDSKEINSFDLKKLSVYIELFRIMIMIHYQEDGNHQEMMINEMQQENLYSSDLSRSQVIGEGVVQVFIKICLEYSNIYFNTQ